MKNYVLVLDQAGGDTVDYTYEELGVVFSYATEGRGGVWPPVWPPQSYGFLAPASEIAPSGEENWAALKALCDFVYDQYNPES